MVLDKPRRNSKLLSIITFDDSQGKMTPPGGPKLQSQSPMLLLSNRDDDFSALKARQSAWEAGSIILTCW
ncbi:hypothetical protein Plhal703r1_c39g0136811 [Plasmopara halstedii]